jgi:hypothetical protein
MDIITFMGMGMHTQDLILLLLLLLGGFLVQLILQVYLCELLKFVKTKKKNRITTVNSNGREAV